MDFASAKYDVADAFAANELYQDNGWTDGLPIVAPTDALMRTFLEAAGMAPGDVVAAEPVRRRRITAEKVAIAAVMAGCRPDYMPVVLAVVRALCDTEYGLHGVSASTGGSAPFIVVNGPIRNAIGMNATHNALANASRANMPTYSIWAGNYFMIIGRQNRDVFTAARWSKQDIREYVHERAWVKRGDWASVGKTAVVGKDPDRVHTALRTPDDLLVVSAGGPAGGFGAIIPPWLGAKSLAITTRIEEKP